jgi:predicted MFS family arabinose efflux permease
MRGRAGVAIFLFGTAGFWNGGNVGPVARELEKAFDTSLSAIGLLSGTAFFAVIVLVALTVAPATRALGAARTARIACLLMVVGNVLIAVAPAFWLAFVGRMVVGIGVTLDLVIGPAIARAEGGVRLLSVYGASVMFGVAAALGIGGLLVDAGASWQLTFWLSAAIAAAAFPLLPRHVEVRPPGHIPPDIVKRLIESAPEWRLLALFAAALGIPMVIGAWLNGYLITEGGVSASVAGLVAFALFGVSTAARLASGRLAASGFSPALMAGAAPLVAAAGLVLLAVEPSVGVALPAAVLMGVGFALPYAVMYDEAERLFPKAPVASLSFLSSGANVIPAVAIPIVGGALDSGHGEAALLVLAVLVVVGGIANLRPAARAADAA